MSWNCDQRARDWMQKDVAGSSPYFFCLLHGRWRCDALGRPCYAMLCFAFASLGVRHAPEACLGGLMPYVLEVLYRQRYRIACRRRKNFDVLGQTEYRPGVLGLRAAYKVVSLYVLSSRGTTALYGSIVQFSGTSGILVLRTQLACCPDRWRRE